MTDDSKATPRPWRAHNNGVCWQIDGELNAVVTTQFCYSHSPEADAALIVTAVNAHDALVAERDEARSDCEMALKISREMEAERDRLRQALEEAQEAMATALLPINEEIAQLTDSYSENATGRREDVIDEDGLRALLPFEAARDRINAALVCAREAIRDD